MGTFTLSREKRGEENRTQPDQKKRCLRSSRAESKRASPPRTLCSSTIHPDDSISNVVAPTTVRPRYSKDLRLTPLVQT